MNKKKELLIVLLSAGIITFLFHRQSLGLNLLIFTVLLLTYLKFTKQIRVESRNQIISLVGLVITSLFTIICHSLFSYIMYFIALFIFIGMLIYPEVKSLATSTILSWCNVWDSQVNFLKNFSELDIKSKKIYSRSRKLLIFVVPLIIILFFVFLYRVSNQYFDALVVNSMTFFNDNLYYFFKDFDFWIILTFFIGLLVSNFLFLRTSLQYLIMNDKNSSDFITRTRIRIRKRAKFNVLKDEYKAGIFLFLILNLVLLLVNIVDTYWVWFNFEWQGQNLKQFVHEGTYILIFSILISLSLVLFFFRKNLNYYPKNRLLKYLCYIWLTQNVILAISVAIRNFWYINYYSLAYKRIGVIIFLVLTIYGLYTVYIKVKQKKSTFYLIKMNFSAIFIVLIISSLINWDSLIADYNIKHSDKSFLHLDFMAELSDQTLPKLDISLTELIRIDSVQKDIFHLEHKFMTPRQYCKVIEARKLAFKRSWEAKNILEWNLPEYLAYTSIVLDRTKN